MKYILLETLPITSWVSIGLTLGAPVMWWLIKQALKAQTDRMDRIETRAKEEGVRITALELADRNTNEKIHNVKEVVLKEINSIALAVERFRNENPR